MNRSSSHRETNRMTELDEMVRAAKAAASEAMPACHESIGSLIVQRAWLMTVAQMGVDVVRTGTVKTHDVKGRA
jgi:hypothetical protein